MSRSNNRIKGPDHILCPTPLYDLFIAEGVYARPLGAFSRTAVPLITIYGYAWRWRIIKGE